jgi:hypothetical protein
MTGRPIDGLLARGRGYIHHDNRINRNAVIVGAIPFDWRSGGYPSLQR